MEKWKSIKGYEGLYEISSFGRVKSYHIHRGTKERILSPRKVKDGYLMVALYKNKKHHNYQLHHLVADAFLKNPDKFTEINHKDLNKCNNHVDNLEWISHYDNIKHYLLTKERRLVQLCH